jgi:hypothetical protein
MPHKLVKNSWAHKKSNMKLFIAQIVVLLLSPSATLAQTASTVAAQAMQQARSVIGNMVQANPLLTPAFIRMGFHDCVGGCDGKSIAFLLLTAVEKNSE